MDILFNVKRNPWVNLNVSFQISICIYTSSKTGRGIQTNKKEAK